MTADFLANQIEHELKYHFRKRVEAEVRKCSPDSDPMVTGITVMLGTVLALAAFRAVMKGDRSGRTR